MEKEILHFDMDGVVADFEKKIFELDPMIEKLPFGSDERNNRVDEAVWANPTIFEDLDPIDGAIEVVKRLADDYDVYFLSTPMDSCPESFKGKKIWLNKHFGELAKKKLILTHRKDLAIGDFLVDDRLVNGAENFKGTFIHFGSENFPDWEVVDNYFTKRLEHKTI